MFAPIAGGLRGSLALGRRAVPKLKVASGAVLNAARATAKMPAVRLAGGVAAVGASGAFAINATRRAFHAPVTTEFPEVLGFGDGITVEDARESREIRQQEVPSAGEFFADNWLLLAGLVIAALYLTRRT